MLELLLVVVILSVLTLVAYPSLKSISERDREAGAVTHMARLINKVRASAAMRHRAYAVIFRLFSANRPQGAVDIREGSSPSCRPLSEDLVNNSRFVQSYFLGQTAGDNPETGKEDNVGLLDAVPPGARAGGQVQLCVKPDGSILHLLALEPFTGPRGDRGIVTIRVQRFQDDQGAWSPAGPARTLEIPFAGPARLGLNR